MFLSLRQSFDCPKEGRDTQKRQDDNALMSNGSFAAPSVSRWRRSLVLASVFIRPLRSKTLGCSKCISLDDEKNI